MLFYFRVEMIKKVEHSSKKKPARKGPAYADAGDFEFEDDEEGRRVYRPVGLEYSGLVVCC